MTSPIPPTTAEHGSALHRLVTPTARVFTAAVILFTGAGVAAVFWKMPATGVLHELCHESVVDESLSKVPLPSESVASISPEEREQIVLPTLDISPLADSGVVKYGQAYDAPASFAVSRAEPTREEPALPPVIPQKFEPMRQIVEEKPISVEPVNRQFLAKPISVNTTEKSDELLSRFHFAENSRAELEDSVPKQPVDPFPMPVMAAPTPVLQPLQPLPFEGLSPLLPLQENELLPLSALTVM